jgi:SrtB family sortase
MKNKAAVLHVFFAAGIFLTVLFMISLDSVHHTDRQGHEFYAALPVEYINSPPPPEEEEIFVPSVNFDSLGFPSVTAWIKSEGTVIDYPIVQADDNCFYLHNLPDQSRHKWGSIFMDYRNSADFSDPCILIYGHNIRSGDMFGSLKYYKNQSYFEQHPSMFICTPQNDFILEIFAGYVLDSASEAPPLNFSDRAHFESFITDIRRRSFFESNVQVDFGDKIVFLCTCTDGGSADERLIIGGKLK